MFNRIKLSEIKNGIKEWNGVEGNKIECNGIEWVRWNGIEKNELEWDRMEWNGMG